MPSSSAASLPQPPPRSKRATLALLAVAGLAVSAFVANLTHHLLHDTLCCADDAYIAVAAKNLATGRGYVSSYYPDVRGNNRGSAYDPLLSTGPTVVVPAAAAVRLWGNRYWVPGAASMMLTLLLLGALLAHLAASDRSPARWGVTVVATILSLNLVTLGHYEHWYTLLGEMPALLLLALGVLLILDGGGGWRAYAGGGLLIGCAALTKTLALLAVPGLLGLLLVLPPRPGTVTPAAEEERLTLRHRLRRGLRAAALTLAFVCVPPALFDLAKLLDLGAAGFLESKRFAAANIQSSPSAGLASALTQGLGNHLRTASAANWPVLAEYFGSPWSAVAFLAALAIGLAARERWRGRDAAPLVLLAIAALYVLWWLPFSDKARIRYLLIGLGLFCLGVLLDLVRGPWSWRKTALAVVFSVALVPRAVHFASVLPKPPYFAPGPRVQAMLATVQLLERAREDRMVVADWWASGVDIEYLLAGSGNVISHLSLAGRGNPPALFVENAKWIHFPGAGVSERWNAALAHANAVLAFEQSPYRVYAAPPLDRSGAGTP